MGHLVRFEEQVIICKTSLLIIKSESTLLITIVPQLLPQGKMMKIEYFLYRRNPGVFKSTTLDNNDKDMKTIHQLINNLKYSLN